MFEKKGINTDNDSVDIRYVNDTNGSSNEERPDTMCSIMNTELSSKMLTSIYSWRVKDTAR